VLSGQYIPLTGCGLQVLEDIPKGRLLRSILNVPVFDKPPAAVQALKGYQEGAFDPEKRGAAYLVVTVPGVAGVIKTNSNDAQWGLNPMGAVNQSETSQPSMRKIPCTCRSRDFCTAPVVAFTPYKFWLVEPGFLASAADNQPPAAEPSPEATDPPGVPGADTIDQGLPAASADDPPAALTPAGKKTLLHPHRTCLIPFAVDAK